MLIRKHIVNTWTVSSEVFLINSLIYSSYCDHCLRLEILNKRVFKVSHIKGPCINCEQYRNAQHFHPTPHLGLLVQKAGWSDATDKTHQGHSKTQVQPDPCVTDNCPMNASPPRLQVASGSPSTTAACKGQVPSPRTSNLLLNSLRNTSRMGRWGVSRSRLASVGEQVLQNVDRNSWLGRNFSPKDTSLVNARPDLLHIPEVSHSAKRY